MRIALRSTTAHRALARAMIAIVVAASWQALSSLPL
jgi:hypothetical protein